MNRTGQPFGDPIRTGTTIVDSAADAERLRVSPSDNNLPAPPRIHARDHD